MVRIWEAGLITYGRIKACGGSGVCLYIAPGGPWAPMGTLGQSGQQQMPGGQPMSSALVMSGMPAYEGTGYASLAASQSGLDGFQRVNKLTEKTQRHLDMRLTADQSGDYRLGNEQSGMKKDYPKFNQDHALDNLRLLCPNCYLSFNGNFPSSGVFFK